MMVSLASHVQPLSAPPNAPGGSGCGASARRCTPRGLQKGASLFTGHHLGGNCRPRLLAVQAQKRPGNNMNEDTDAMYSDLLEKYGKVVYTRKDSKLASAEVDDDNESLSFAVTLAKVADDVKAADIRVLFVKPLVYWTRFFIIATAFSNPQIDAIGTRIRDVAEKQFNRVPSGDTKPNSWTLLDFGDVVVHIFLPEMREYYNLEDFYGNATPIELHFDDQPPLRR